MSAGDPGGGGFVDRFVSSVSHELRTPLSVVVGYAELLAHRDDEATRHAAIARIHEAANRLSSLIDALLMAVALDAGSVASVPQPVDLGESLAAAAARLAHHGEGRQVTLAREDGAPWPLAWADPDHVAFILDQLLWSACSGPAGEEIVLAARRENGHAVVSVGESGAAYGLPIVRELVELQGGSSRVGGERGDASFSFSLRLAPGEAGG